jgi:HEAT repeat protein
MGNMGDMEGRGKRVAMLAVAGGIIGLAGAGIASREWIYEEWCIWRSRSGDVDAQLAAIQWLEAKKSPRAIPTLIANLYAENLQPHGERNEVSMDGRSAVALIRIGPPVVAPLTQAVTSPTATAVLCKHAVEILKALPPKGDVVAGLEAIAKRSDGDIRRAADDALKQIGEQANESGQK